MEAPLSWRWLERKSRRAAERRGETNYAVSFGFLPVVIRGARGAGDISTPELNWDRPRLLWEINRGLSPIILSVVERANDGGQRQAGSEAG